MESNISPNKIEFIQMFRGIAAVLVVLYHASAYISPYGTGLGDLLFGPAGTFGVTLFFIISGFIMAHTTVRQEPTPRFAIEFCIRRFSRIWPVLVVACAMFVCLARLPFLPFTREMAHTILHTLTFIPAGDGPAPNFGETLPSVAWTLNYEIYFYAFFAASILFGRMRWIALAAWAVISLMAIPHLLVGYWSLHTSPTYGLASTYLNLITYPVIWEFLAGVVIGLVYNSRLRVPEWFPSGLLMCLSVAMVAWQYVARFKVGYGITEWGTTLIPLVAIFALANKKAEFQHHPVFTPLGNISFSLYLWHPLVQAVSGYPLTWWGYGNLCTGFSFVLYTTTISIAVAAISHELLEKRLSEFAKDFLSRVFLKAHQSPRRELGAL